MPAQRSQEIITARYLQEIKAKEWLKCFPDSLTDLKVNLSEGRW